MDINMTSYRVLVNGVACNGNIVQTSSNGHNIKQQQQQQSDQTLRSCYSVYKELQRDEFKRNDQTQDTEFQQRIDRLYPSDYRSSIREEQREMLEECKRALEWSSTIGDCSGIEQSFIRLKSYLNLKYPLYKADYEYFIVKLFNMLYDGKVPSVSNSIMTYLFILLVKGKKLIDIVIDWKPLYNLFKVHYSYNTFPLTMLSEVNDKSKTKVGIHSLIVVSRPFFSTDAFDEIMNEVKPLLCPHSNSVYVALYIMTALLPTHQLVALTKLPEWTSEFLSYWEWLENNEDWDERWLMLFSRIVKHSRNINWTELAPRFYTHFIRVIDLSMGNPKFSHLKPIKHHVPSYLKINREDNIEYTSMGQIIASLITSNGDTMDLFARLFSSISSYFHPSNQGDWSIPLLELIISSCHSFAKKHLKYNFSKEIVNQFLENVLPHIESSLYSKKKNNILNTCKIIKELSYIAPEIILPDLLEKLYGSVDKEEVNRVISELEVVSTCFHPLIAQPDLFPDGKSHVYNLMVLAMNSMDPIYPNKSSAAFKFFNRIFSCVLLNDETIYMNDNDMNENDTKTALTTASFLDWSLLFLDSVLTFIKNASTKKEFAEHKRVTPPGVFLNETIELFFCQMSDEVYTAILEKLVHFFNKTFEPDYYKQYSSFLVAATLRNPSKSLATFMPIFIKKLFKVSANNEYVIRDLSDEEYKWYIQLMGYTLFKSGAALLEHREEFDRICSVLYDSNNKTITKQVSKILRKAIYSLSRYYPSNNRSIPSDLLAKNESHIKYWGTTDESLIFPIEWFQPTKETINLSIELIDKFIIQRVELLDQYIESIKKTPSQFDRMKSFNFVKSIYSVMRTAILVMEDEEEKPVVNEIRYNLKPMSPAHGRILVEKFKNAPSRIYQVLNKLLVFVEDQRNEEVNLLKVLAKSLVSLNSGYADIQDRTSESLFTKWKNLKRYKTRNALVFKAYKAHLLRQKIAYEKLPMTKTCRGALADLTRLSVHRYKQVRKLAQDAVCQVAGHHHQATQDIVSRAIDYFTSQRSDEEIKGSVYLMSKKLILKKLKTQWKYINPITITFLSTFDPKFKATTREAFMRFKQQFLLSKYEPILINHLTIQMLDIEHYDPSNGSGIVPKDIMIKQISTLEKKNIQNISSLRDMVEKIVGQLKVHEKKDNLAWKELIFLQSYMIYLISSFLKSITTSDKEQLKLAVLGSLVNGNNDKMEIDSHNGNGGAAAHQFGELLIKNISMIKDSIISIFKNMNSDYPITRILSTNLISQILFEQELGTRDICYENFWSVDDGLNVDPKDSEDVVILKSLSSLILPSLQLVLDDTFLDKLLKYISQDHDTEGQSHNIGVAISSKNLSLVWPNTRHTVSSKLFKIPNAKLFYSFLSWNELFYDRIKAHIEVLKTKTDKEDQSLLSEIVAGLGRFVTSGPDTFSKRQEAITYLSDLLFTSLNNCSNELNDAWIVTIRFISYNTKVENLTWLIDTLLRLYNNPLNIFSQAKSIRFFKALLFEVTYKSKELLDKLMDICHKEFSDPYKQVRDEVFKLFVNILAYQCKYTNNEGTKVLLLEPPILPQKSIDTINAIIKETGSELSTDTRNNIKETLIAMVSHTFSKGHSNCMVRLTPTVLPTIFSFTSDVNQDTAKEAMICVASIAQGFYFDRQILTEIIQQLRQISSSSFWRVRRSVLPFLQILFFNHQLFFTTQQIDQVFDIVLSFTRDPQIEVRELAKDTLASILISSKCDKSRIQSLISTSIENLTKSKVTPENSSQKHQYILILGAIVLSSPYSIPSYFPEVLEVLSRYSSSAPPLRDTVQSTLSEFWRTHKSTWEEEKLMFDEEQREMIRGTVAYPSYYA